MRTPYYTGWNLNSGISQFNVCTNTPASTSTNQVLFDDVRVLPNWSVLTIGDDSASLRDASGNLVNSWGPSAFNGGDLRTVSLNPDGMSFWTAGDVVTQVDLNSGQVLQSWVSTFDSNPFSFGDFSSFIAVYAPPLVGNADVAPAVGTDPAGTAAGLPHPGHVLRNMTGLHLRLSAAATARQVVVGIYSNRLRLPSTLQAQETITNPRPGSWNEVGVPSTSVAGQLYWLAVLAPRGGGLAAFRDRRLSGLSLVTPVTTSPRSRHTGRADA